MRFTKPYGMMPQSFTSLLRHALVLMAVSLPGTALAQGQFFLLAQQAPLSSLTGTAAAPSQVYLRWDLVEGTLPTDIVLFRLYRDGSAIGDFPASGTMSAARIAQLYQGRHQQRRLLERVSSMKEEAARDDNIADFPASQFAQAIYARLNSDDTFWAAISARLDFNIAVARYRGTYDAPGSGVFSYELRAVNNEGDERRVGLAEVDTRTSTGLLANQNFSQIQQADCDEPDFRDHFTVALNWDGPQTGSQADELAHRLFVAGYDLYRATSPLAEGARAPERDLASEAASASADNQGNPVLRGLERVNDVLILTHPDGSATPEWLETQDALQAAGLKPGDRRAYYLVARDFAGQYGPTLATEVTVPDQARPPAPWDISAWLDEAEQHVELVFPAVDTAGYIQNFSSGRTLCPVTDDDGIVEFVPEGESCEEHPHVRVNTDISGYLIYRFEDSASANAFSDSDADGYSDREERASGNQCVPAANDGATLIARAEHTPDEGNRIRVSDDTPAASPGEVYWYRLAAVSRGGRLSLLSEPVRVNFPDRSLPARPAVTLTHPAPQVCDCAISYDNNGSGFSIDVAAPLNPDSAAVACYGQDFGWTPDQILNPKQADAACATYSAACGDYFPTYSFDIPGTNNRCEVTPTGGNNFCQSGTMTIEPVYCDEPTETSGGFITGPLTVHVEEVEPGTCVSLFQRIGSRYTRVDSTCGSERDAIDFVQEQGEFCGYAVAQDGNNNISPASSVPCSQVADADAPAPLPPRPESLLLGTVEATIQWQAPRQPQVTTELELVRTSPAGFTPQRHALPGDAGEQSVTLTIPERTASLEEWCARVRSVGATIDSSVPNTSDWSAPVCVTRSDTVPPEWLPWPEATPVPQGDDLQVLNNNIATAPAGGPLSSGLHIPLLSIEAPGNCNAQLNLVGRHEDYRTDDMQSWLDLRCPRADLAAVRGQLHNQLNFVVFRQARRPDGTTSELVQISPLLNYVHWSEYQDIYPNGAKDTPVSWLWLNDPFIWVQSEFLYATNTPGQLRFVYVDRAGLTPGWDYRYQIIWFGEHQSLEQWRMSPWTTFDTTSPNTAATAVPTTAEGASL